MNQRPLDEYLTMPYSRVLIPDETGGYVAEVLEFPGCIAEGETADEAMSNLNNSMEAWIEAAEESDVAVPQPLEFQAFSGRLLLRIAKAVHKEATRRAEIEGVSLNQWIVDAIGERLGKDRCLADVREVLAAGFYQQQNWIRQFPSRSDVQLMLGNAFTLTTFDPLASTRPLIIDKWENELMTSTALEEATKYA